MRIVKIVAVTILALLAACLIWLVTMPPELLRVGSGYAAKIVCSNVFLANRDAQEVLAVDVQAPGHPLLRLMQVSVDEQSAKVSAAIFGFIAPSVAIYRDDLGCAVTQDLSAKGQRNQSPPIVGPESGAADVLFPDGTKIESDQRITPLLENAALTGPGMRAVIVAQNGRILGERYAEGFSEKTPLIGWSMAKTINAALIARLVGEGKLAYTDRNLFAQWASDERGEITLAQLLAMESGLGFNENYGTVADVTRMLFLEQDMAEFAIDTPLEAAPGTKFSYSSGTSVLLSKIWMERIGDQDRALVYPRQSLFAPLGMQSAVFETDANGTYAGSSYIYATARDWTRFGMFLAADGMWKGERLLPEGTVAMMGKASAQSGGRYSQMQTWLKLYGRDAEGLPGDMFMLSGHDGQTVAVVPSLGLVVLRMGLTPLGGGYNVLELIAAAAKAVK
ncbi:serine hydrolase [Neorhizobium sp. JUb45]|uniref:serine hydrolase domain-containing protein n=1 Tax=unclassified Neorhizobium TaxID=2629175 RepID=UPI0010473D33|nr:serine hydrolase [Neorhizobium sp. JUb45]TCR07006.1 CubicO group peptidase (beta-lactamase class C family) [Neorhizobium sp. JUb45]